MLALLVISSFGSMVCGEEENQRCSCSVLGRLVLAIASDDFAEDPCPCECDSEEESQDCGEQLVGMECNLYETAKAPSPPAYVEDEAANASESLASLFRQSTESLRKSRLRVPPPIVHGRDPALSSIVLRV